jgi:hypothetical protein
VLTHRARPSPQAIGDNGVAKGKSSTKRPTVGALRATIAELLWRVFALETLLKDAKVPDDIKARRLTNAAKLVNYGRSAGHKRIDITWQPHIAENLRRFSKNPRGAGRKPLGADDHYQLLITASLLDSKDRHSKLAIAKALLKTEQYKHLNNIKSVYKNIDKALKFFKDNPNSYPDLMDILSKLPPKIPL